MTRIIIAALFAFAAASTVPANSREGMRETRVPPASQLQNPTVPPSYQSSQPAYNPPSYSPWGGYPPEAYVPEQQGPQLENRTYEPQLYFRDPRIPGGFSTIPPPDYEENQDAPSGDLEDPERLREEADPFP